METRITDTQVDFDQIKISVEQFLMAIGEDLSREGLQGTPDRVARMWRTWRQKKAFSMAFFGNTKNYDEMVLCKDITFYSICEHHMIPFFGKVHIAYLPDRMLVGLSKIPRIVEHFALGLNIQEQLTKQIAVYLNNNLQPFGVAVVMEAEHLCMSMRGVKKPGHKTITSSLIGAFKEQSETRTEFMQLIK